MTGPGLPREREFKLKSPKFKILSIVLNKHLNGPVGRSVGHLK